MKAVVFGLFLCLAVSTVVIAPGCYSRSEYQSGFEDGYAKALKARGSRIPTPEDRSSDYQRGFVEGWQKGLKENHRLNSEKDKGP